MKVEQLIDAVADAKDQGQSLQICGGNSKAFMGREIQCDRRIDMAKHCQIVSYKPTELVITVKAGTPLKLIEDTLCENRQVLGAQIDDFDGTATIGGSLATDINGPARPWRGALRDAVLGCRLINGHAEYLRFGGTVMKNVAGYDVSRLQAGAYGSLGLIEELSLKVLPAPAASETLCLEQSAAQAITLMNRIAGRAVPLSGAAWIDGTLYLRLCGAASAVAHFTKVLGYTPCDPSIWQHIQQAHRLAAARPMYRLSLPANAPSAGLDYRLINWAGAERWLDAQVPLATMAATAKKLGGQVRLLGRHPDNCMFPEPDAAYKRLLSQLKTAFDPQAIFNPGKLYHWN